MRNTILLLLLFTISLFAETQPRDYLIDAKDLPDVIKPADLSKKYNVGIITITEALKKVNEKCQKLAKQYQYDGEKQYAACIKVEINEYQWPKAVEIQARPQQADVVAGIGTHGLHASYIFNYERLSQNGMQKALGLGVTRSREGIGIYADINSVYAQWLGYPWFEELHNFMTITWGIELGMSNAGSTNALSFSSGLFLGIDFKIYEEYSLGISGHATYISGNSTSLPGHFFIFVRRPLN